MVKDSGRLTVAKTLTVSDRELAVTDDATDGNRNSVMTVWCVFDWMMAVDRGVFPDTEHTGIVDWLLADIGVFVDTERTSSWASTEAFFCLVN